MAGVKKIGKERLYVVVIIAMAALVMYMFLQNTITSGSQQAATDSVKTAYEKLTESEVEVLSVKDEGYLYRVMLRLKFTEGDVLREVYSTKDGRFFSEAGNVFEVSGLLERLDKEKTFAECLRTKGFLVLGQKSEPNTLQQLLIIGNYVNKIYIECSDANLQACQQLGIERIPTIFYNNRTYEGVQTREWIETLTGCKY